MATVIKSNTTQNVAAGGAVSGGVAYAVLAALRSVAPDLLPWPPDTDMAIAMALTAVLTPLVSRVIAFKRAPEKAVVAGMDTPARPPDPPKELSEDDKAAFRVWAATEWAKTAPKDKP